MGGTKQRFHLVLIKPTHYDDDGYPITWLRSHIPSNTLAALYGLGEDSRSRQVLGPDVEPGSDTWQMFIGDVVKEITQKAGQKCTAVRRIVIPAEREAEFNEARRQLPVLKQARVDAGERVTSVFPILEDDSDAAEPENPETDSNNTEQTDG